MPFRWQSFGDKGVRAWLSVERATLTQDPPAEIPYLKCSERGLEGVRDPGEFRVLAGPKGELRL